MNQQTFDWLFSYWLLPSFGGSLVLSFAGSYVSRWLGYVLAALCLVPCAGAAMFGIVFSGQHESIFMIGAVMFGPGLIGVVLGLFLGRNLGRA